MIGKSFMVNVLAGTLAVAFVVLVDEAGLMRQMLGWRLITSPRSALEQLEVDLANSMLYPDVPYGPISRTERIAIPQILTGLRSKTYSEILVLTLSSDICQQIACQGAPAETVRRFVERYLNIRIADDTRATAEQSKWIAFGGLILAFIALLVSIATFWRSVRVRKPITPP